MSEDAIRAAFRKQAEWGVKLHSPFVALVCDILAETLDDSTATGRRVLGWEGDPLIDALALRLLGGLHALVRRGRLPGLASMYPPAPMPEVATLTEALRVALADADGELLTWLDSAPQTNEVGRSALLYAGLLVLAAETGLPFRLFELGASAGLNLRLDHYGYTLGGEEFGVPGAAVHLAPTWEAPPPPRAAVQVASRAGVDLNPIDVRDPAMRDRLLAYVWPDQTERLARLEAALAEAAADPPLLDKADAAGWVETHVDVARGFATVVQHSIAFQYFPADTQARIVAHLEKVGGATTADAPLAWLRYEFIVPDRAPELRLRLWPGGEDRLLATGHPHGAEVRWVGP